VDLPGEEKAMTEQFGTPMRLMLDSASPGQAALARVTIEGEPAPLSVFLLREDDEHVFFLGDEVDVQIRAGGFVEGDVFVAAIVVWIGDTQYEIWLNYHNREHRLVFDDLAGQDRLLYAFIVDSETPRRMLVTPNTLTRFITDSIAESRRRPDWTMDAFNAAKAILQAKYASVMDLWNALQPPPGTEPDAAPPAPAEETAAAPVPAASAAPTEPCPRCAEDIPVGAKACPYCGTVFGQQAAVAPATPPPPSVTPSPPATSPPPPVALAPVAVIGLTPPPPPNSVPPTAYPAPPPPPPTAYSSPPPPTAYSPPPPPPPQTAPYMQPVYPTAPTPGYAPPPGYAPGPGYAPQVPPSAGWTYESGLGALSVIPPQIRKWNWGAFFFTWIWGIANGTYIAFFALIPYVGFVMPFVLGAKGSEWAWSNKHWQSVEQFRDTQRSWAIAGAVVFGILIVLSFFIGMIEGFSQ